ncbi:MAG: hypothetical protein HQL31_08670, partial [Planctomycetes bacterium]|nr:hypothetical protein [Planctomycetota bacterium]
EELELVFSSRHEGVRRAMDGERLRIEERLQALGFEAHQLPSTSIKEDEEDQTEIEVVQQPQIHHLDVHA